MTSISGRQAIKFLQKCWPDCPLDVVMKYIKPMVIPDVCDRSITITVIFASTDKRHKYDYDYMTNVIDSNDTSIPTAPTLYGYRWYRTCEYAGHILGLSLGPPYINYIDGKYVQPFGAGDSDDTTTAMCCFGKIIEICYNDYGPISTHFDRKTNYVCLCVSHDTQISYGKYSITFPCPSGRLVIDETFTFVENSIITIDQHGCRSVPL